MQIDRNTIYTLSGYQFKNFSLLTEEEVEQVWKWRNHEAIRKYTYTTEIIQFESHVKFITSLKTRKNVCYWLVLKSGNPIGVINLTDIDDGKSSAELGYYIVPEMLNAGIGLEFAYYNFMFAFQTIGCAHLHGGINRTNINALMLDSYLGCKVRLDQLQTGVEFIAWEAYREEFLSTHQGKNDMKTFVRYVKSHRKDFLISNINQ